MPAKYVDVPEIGQIALYKRRGASGVKLSITHDGTIRVTLPLWAPYRLGVEFARNKAEWLAKKRKPKQILLSGDRVGKAHRFVFEERPERETVGTRIVGTDIRLFIPKGLEPDSKELQDAAEKAAVKALKKEGEQLLPQRLKTLAAQHGFSYSTVAVKRLRSRWGSCNERKDIVFNCYLMQLPWHLIDYVILHELTHTQILRHGDPFWRELAKYVPKLAEIRKEMKLHQPTLVVTHRLTQDDAEMQHIPVEF